MALHTKKLLVTFSPPLSPSLSQSADSRLELFQVRSEAALQKLVRKRTRKERKKRRKEGEEEEEVQWPCVDCWCMYSCLPVVQVEVTVRCTAEDELPLVHTVTSKTKIRYIYLSHHVLPW